MKWQDLFNYVQEKVNFRYQEGKPETPENAEWTCHRDLRFTKEFLTNNGIPWKLAIQRLKDTGGYCDCEVLFNSVEQINGNGEIPQ